MRFVLSGHARTQMFWREISVEEVRSAMRQGKNPRPSEEHLGCLVVEGRVEGRKIAVVYNPLSDPLEVLTAWLPD